VVLSEGRIIEEGSHDELVLQDGLYRQLYEIQFRDAAVTRRRLFDKQELAGREEEHSRALTPDP
ncbi:MAG TPA: hypothetical protein VG778_11435, partial [Blastocatellia bacterium]|nr:hypothetical protein [Blastocatellia bacterium]